MPGFLVRLLTRFLARFLTRVFGQGFLDRKYSVQVYRDRGIQFYSTTGTEKYSFTVLQGQRKIEENHVLKIPCIKNPILLKIPYIKNLAVRRIIRLSDPNIFRGGACSAPRREAGPPPSRKLEPE